MRHALRLLVAVTVLMGLAAACGSKSKPATATNTTAPVSVGPGTTSPALSPKPGGNLVFGTEAEIDGFDPTKNRWDANGYLYAETVFDPLTAIGADNQVHPYLAQSVDHNADYTVWTITLRPGVTFSNGDPLTAADVVYDLRAVHDSLLTGSALQPVSSIDQTGTLSLEVHMKEAWVPFPVYLAFQPGYIASPKMLKDPNGSRHPIGTGPFIFKEWVPGNHFTATKNPNYWRKGLPYLDSIEYRPILEETSRLNSLKTGDIDIMGTSDAQTIASARADKSLANIDDSQGSVERPVSMIMLDTAKPPLDNLLARQAVAYATDRQQIINVAGEPFIPVADSPFGPGSKYHVDNPGYPNYDLNKARQLVAQYEAQTGKKLTFQLGIINTAKGLQDAQFVQDMWSQAGINVNIVQVEQSQYILNALEGAYQAYFWIQFGDFDPDEDFVWWSSTTAMPVGQLSLNFSRVKDTQLDADLEAGRHTADPAARVAAYQDVARRLDAQLPYIWISGIVSDISTRSNVHGVTTATLPDGSVGVSIGPSAFQPWHVWVG